jgi:MFS transporter, DHA1 family, inner membrane transport protein
MAVRAGVVDRYCMSVVPLPAEALPSAGERASFFRSPSTVLFVALFASQAGVLVMSPILADVADEFGVSIAEAGQLRILAAPLAAIVAVAAGRLLVRLSPRALLGSGSALLAIGSLASAAAPTFHVLALAQVPMWAGVALLIAAGVAATAAWSEPARRTKVVAHALAGPPAAWIVGMPVIGVVAEIDWRLTFLALPLPAALVAGLAVLGRPRDEPLAGARSSLAGLLGRHDARRWALGELLANAAWTGTLVYSGALFTEVHGLSPAATGVVLALVAAVYLVGNQWAGRADATRTRRAMLEASVLSAVALALTWSYAPGEGVTIALFAVAAFFAAARTVSGTVFGFSIAGDLGREVGAIRAATTQLGYLIGSLAGGIALAVGGFEALAVAFGGLLLASTLPYVCVRPACRSRLAVQPTP